MKSHYLLVLPVLGLSASTSSEDSAEIETPVFIQQADFAWDTNTFPIQRWKTLVGGDPAENSDILFGLWELAPHAIYHGHRHESPAIYYILSGRAIWTVGEESREVTQGSLIRTPPGESHRMENLGDEKLQAIWVWWAPNGDQSVFEADYIFTEDAPDLLPDVGFTD